MKRARRIGEHQRVHPQARQHPHGKRDLGGRESFIKMRPARKHRHRNIIHRRRDPNAPMSSNAPPGNAGRPVRDLRVGNLYRTIKLPRHLAESAPKNHAHARPGAQSRLNKITRLENFPVWCHLLCPVLCPVSCPVSVSPGLPLAPRLQDPRLGYPSLLILWLPGTPPEPRRQCSSGFTARTPAHARRLTISPVRLLPRAARLSPGLSKFISPGLGQCYDSRVTKRPPNRGWCANQPWSSGRMAVPEQTLRDPLSRWIG